MKIKSLFISTVAALTLLSCEDAYKVGPADEITDQNAITNIDQLELALTGVYGAVGGRNLIEWNSYFTDEVRKNAQNAGQGVQVHTWSINSGTDEPASYYSGLYTTIRSVNGVLAKIDGITILNDDQAAERERVRGELLTIRAMAQFDLARFFSPNYEASSLATPIVDHYIVFEKLPRNTWGEVISYVEQDLATAYTILSAQSDNSDITRVTPLAVQAIRARVALYNKEYDNALTYANEVIAAVPLATTAAQVLSIYTDASDVESVWKLKRVSGDDAVGTLFTEVDGRVYFNVSTDLYNQFSSGDYRRQAGVLYASGSGLSNLLVGKYSNNSTNKGLADIKLFRVAEMYLIAAEANVLKPAPSLTAAATTLTTLRNARGITGSITFNDAADAISKILLERRKELCYEGHRFFDLKRFHLGVNRIASDVVLNDFAQTLPADSYKFTLPIPSSGIQYNSNLVQNPQY